MGIMSEDFIVVAEHLAYAYPNKRVLKDINFKILKGSITTFIGANGSGKSTLFQILTKNLKSQMGSALIHQNNIETLKLKEFSHMVASVQQYHQNIDNITVFDLVSLGHQAKKSIFQRLNKNDLENNNWAIEVTQLQNLKTCFFSQLSGGEKQRVWLALALAQKTEILILDEPTTYLDMKYQIDFLKLIQKINREFKITILMILHDINQAITFSDTVIGLKNGKCLSRNLKTDSIDEQFIETIFNVNLPIIDYKGKK